MKLLLREARRRHPDDDPHAGRAVQRPTSMWELYQWFKARGELAYYYANIAPKP
jgi:hypothetical protein